MTWDAAMQHEQLVDRIRDDNLASWAALETAHRRGNGETFHSVMWDRGFRAGMRAAVGWILHQQHEWHSLPVKEAVDELNKGTGSVYHPIFDDGTNGNPTIWADCPTCGREVTDREGLCYGCGYDHTI